MVGIFDTPERAMAALPGSFWRKTTWTHHPNWPDRSVVTHWVSWANELDGDNAGEVRAMDLTDTGPERIADEAVVQTLRESDGGWDYLPEPL